MNREEIKQLLPHREPMLLLDELSMEENVAHGVYRVTGEEWFLQGHYPGNPVVPAVILCEIMAQTCGMLIADDLPGKTPYYTGIDKARFKKMVRPGDIIHVFAQVERSKGPFYFTRCEAKVEGELCASGNMSFMIMEGR